MTPKNDYVVSAICADALYCEKTTTFPAMLQIATALEPRGVEEFQESRLRSSVFARLYHVYAYSPNAHFCSGAFRKNFKVP